MPEGVGASVTVVSGRLMVRSGRIRGPPRAVPVVPVVPFVPCHAEPESLEFDALFF